MTQLASAAQIRNSLLRWLVVTIPLIVLLGSLSGSLSGSSAANPWFNALIKPDIMPPSWLFGAAWTVLYILMGVALAIVLNARGAIGRPAAIGFFVVQLLLNLAWSPLFFRGHLIVHALWLIGVIFVLALITTLAFSRIRKVAGWLMMPYLAWLCFAAVLNWMIVDLNPGGGLPAAVEYQLG